MASRSRAPDAPRGAAHTQSCHLIEQLDAWCRGRLSSGSREKGNESPAPKPMAGPHLTAPVEHAGLAGRGAEGRLWAGGRVRSPLPSWAVMEARRPCRVLGFSRPAKAVEIQPRGSAWG